MLVSIAYREFYKRGRDLHNEACSLICLITRQSHFTIGDVASTP